MVDETNKNVLQQCQVNANINQLEKVTISVFKSQSKWPTFYVLTIIPLSASLTSIG